MTTKNTTVIIDGNSVAYRIFFKAPPLSVDGVQTGVIHVFLTVLNSIQKHKNVDKILVTFDARGKNIRHEMLEEYKATRDSMPEDLSVQIELLKEIIPSMGIPIYSITGYEADDVIYTLSKTATTEKVWIVTKDKDLYQLVSDKVSIYDYQKTEEIEREGVFKKFGVYPEKITEMLSLMGDASDNIPGVKGVGEKTAVSLITKYGDIDNLYAHIDEIKGKQQENLIRDKELAYKSRELVKLIFIDDLQDIVATRDVEKLHEYFVKYKLVSQLNKLKSEQDNADTSMSIEEELSDYKPLTEGEPQEINLLAYVENKLFVCDDTYYREYEKGDIPKYYFDIKSLYKHGIDIDMGKVDIFLAHWLIGGQNNALGSYKLESTGGYLARLNGVTIPTANKLESNELDKLYYELEAPIAIILAKAEMRGIKVVPSVITDVASGLKEQIASLLNKIYDKTKADININSPKQLGTYLFDTLGMKPPKKNKSGYSTDEETLIELRDSYSEHAEMLDDILKFRELNKFASTYTTNLLTFADTDNYIHTDFKQTGTSTGRLSSANPNLQNIPQRSDLASKLRSAFVASDGYTLVSFDYSQIELRVLAHLSGDKNLSHAFNNNVDIHDMTAKKIFSLDDVDDKYRRIAKAVNFGILYGLSTYGLAKDINISNAESKRFIESYFNLYPSVKSYLDNTVAESKRLGYSTTVLGRKRFIPDLNSRNGAIRSRAERMALNAPIQGSAADIIKLAMIACDKYINSSGIDARLILQIHDELIFEVADNIVESFMKDIKEIMENAIDMDVPLTVNGEFAKNWGEL